MNRPDHTRRRFIAGAVCPRCGEMDKMVVNLDTDTRECVAGGFTDERPEGPTPGEVPTRVNRAAARRVETDPQPIRLLDPNED